ncbi:MAG: hypothetical protein K1X67_05465 [Fimbriimonadaceae bacterium]|nr:hypothetical protein [Fimbriimonadaceae bacterium]
MNLLFKSAFFIGLTLAPCAFAWSQPGIPQPHNSWRYYRPSNTGIQGDFCQALWIAPNGDPWIGGYDASFEEGGIAKLVQSTNSWVNVSNVDYPVIGHPDFTGIVRVSDIDVDSSGRMWMATGRGALLYDPAIGPKSLRRFGDDNSPIPGGWNRGVEVAPDGTIWFSSYSTVWGSGGLARYTPSTNQWLVFNDYGGGPLAIQPKPGGGYYVWTEQNDAARYDSTTGVWTVYPRQNNNPAKVPEKNLTDSAGNTWMTKWSDASMNEFRLDLRRPDGTWANTPEPPFGIAVAAIRALGPNQALVGDGGGGVWKFDGTAWQSLGAWQLNPATYDVDIDANGNVWVCGIGGAAKRDAMTGLWQRYRLTNTSQFDFFNNDLTLDPTGGLYACANAGPGYGGMVRFDGSRWIGFNDYHYGLGHDFPFPTDNSESVYMRPSNHQLVVNPMFNGLHTWDGLNWSNLNIANDSVKDVVEDSLGRLWITYYGVVAMRNGNTWTNVSEQGGFKLTRDPIIPGAVWALGDTTVTRTNGTTLFTRSIEDFPQLDPQSDQFKGMAIESNGTVWLGANTINLPDNSSLIRLNPTTGAYTIYRRQAGWPFPGEYLMPLAATPDGRIWMQYDSDYLTAQRGLCWFDGKSVGVYPAPPGGEPQWGGLPHAAILDLEVKKVPGGYELWMSCASRGIAVLSVRTPTRPR